MCVTACPSDHVASFVPPPLMSLRNMCPSMLCPRQQNKQTFRHSRPHWRMSLYTMSYNMLHGNCAKLFNPPHMTNTSAKRLLNNPYTHTQHKPIPPEKRRTSHQWTADQNGRSQSPARINCLAIKQFHRHSCRPHLTEAAA